MVKAHEMTANEKADILAWMEPGGDLAFTGPIKSDEYLDPADFAELVDLFKNEIPHRKTINTNFTTYSIKHAMERHFKVWHPNRGHVYVSEQECVRILLAAGFCLIEARGTIGSMYHTNIGSKDLNSIGSKKEFEKARNEYMLEYYNKNGFGGIDLKQLRKLSKAAK